jgi:ribokinase
MVAIVNPAPAAVLPPAEFSVADVLIPNETEARLLLGLRPDTKIAALDAAHELRQRTHVACVVITLGEQGIVGVDSSGSWRKDPPAVDVVDTSGAGDVFCAAFAVGVVRGWNFRRASEWACEVASLSVTRAGTIPAFPTREEADDLLRQGPR